LLKLRRARVVSVEEDGADRVSRLAVQIDEDESPHPAIAYPALTGRVEPGDDVVVNVEARELGLGSGGFDLLYVNLTRGTGGSGIGGAHVMKLNYTPAQHAVGAIEEGLEQAPDGIATPVAVLALHGQLPCAAFAAASRAPGRRTGYVQTAGGALPGWLSDTVAELLERGLIADHVTVAPCFGGRREAITLEGALHAGAERLGWDAALIGPGPGILGSASALGHGGLSALHSAHSALALQADVILAPRLSSGDERERHRGLSHHTSAVLELLLRPAAVAVPEGISARARAELDRSLGAGVGHEPIAVSIEDLIEPYLESGLPTTTMGRSFAQDEDFFRAGLAAGAALGEKIGAGRA
jgi:uncharacterized protein DUF3866